MFDEALSVVAIWSSLISWLTPAVLFVVLNLVIGTIAFTSGTLSSSPSSSNPHAPLPLPRSQSVLHRLRSLHLSRSDHLPPPSDSVVLKPAVSPLPEPDPDPLLADRNAASDSHAVEERDVVKEEEEEDVAEDEGLDGPTMEQVFDRIQKGYGRSKSDGGYTMAPKKHRKRIIQKAASDISTATGRFEPPPLEEAEEDFEADTESENQVDGKAEDFINRFRQQLNLQRLESLYGATARN